MALDELRAHPNPPDNPDTARLPINRLVLRYISSIEMVGVLMRIFSFSLVSWMGPASPFMFVWVFNTTDAIMLSWCAVLRKDQAYTVLNVFWVMVGIIGVLRAGGMIG
jgi:hypothetical protein